MHDLFLMYKILHLGISMFFFLRDGLWSFMVFVLAYIHSIVPTSFAKKSIFSLMRIALYISKKEKPWSMIMVMYIYFCESISSVPLICVSTPLPIVSFPN